MKRITSFRVGILLMAVAMLAMLFVGCKKENNPVEGSIAIVGDMTYVTTDGGNQKVSSPLLPRPREPWRISAR